MAGKTWLLIGCNSLPLCVAYLSYFYRPFRLRFPFQPLTCPTVQRAWPYSIYTRYSSSISISICISISRLPLCVCIFLAATFANRKRRQLSAPRLFAKMFNIINSPETPTTSTLGLNLRQDADVAAHKHFVQVTPPSSKFVYMPRDCDTREGGVQ